MKSRLSNREQNKAAAASLLAELEEEASLEAPARLKSEIKPQQTGNKVATNRQQSGNGYSSKVATNRQQSGNTTEIQQDEKLETGNKVGTEPATLSATKWQQTGNKLTTKSGFSSLVGLQRALAIFIYECCKISRSHSTDSLTLEHISTSLKARSGSVKTTLQRLEAKGCIQRLEFKNGRSGWSKYQLTESVYSEMLQHETGNKMTTKWQQTGNKVGTEPATEPATTVSSSSRELNFKESSTTQPVDSVFDQVSSLDLSGLREFGITHEVFKRAVQLNPTVTIEGLEDLSFRLSELFKNPKERQKIQNARGFFIKLVEQLAQGITPLDHIETPQDRLMREYALLAKQKRAEQQSFEDTLLQEAFEKWDKETQEEEKLAQVPLAKSAPVGNPRLAVFKEHFRENVWPEKREAILRGEA